MVQVFRVFVQARAFDYTITGGTIDYAFYILFQVIEIFMAYLTAFYFFGFFEILNQYISIARDYIFIDLKFLHRNFFCIQIIIVWFRCNIDLIYYC